MKHKTLKGIILIFTLLFGLNSVSASEMAFEFGKKASVTPLARHVTTTTVSYDSPADFFADLLIEIMTGVWLVNNKKHRTFRNSKNACIQICCRHISFLDGWI